MSYSSYDSLEYAAQQAEDEKRYRTAYGYWKELVTKAQKDPWFDHPYTLEKWIEHMKYCDKMM